MENLIQNLAKVTAALSLGGAIGVGSYVALVPEQEAKPIKRIIGLAPKAIVDSDARKELVDSIGVVTSTLRQSKEDLYPFKPRAGTGLDRASLEEVITSMRDYCYAVYGFIGKGFEDYNKLAEKEKALGYAFKKYNIQLNPSLLWEDVNKINSVLVPHGYIFFRSKSRNGFHTDFNLIDIAEKRDDFEITLFNPKTGKDEVKKTNYIGFKRMLIKPFETYAWGDEFKRSLDEAVAFNVEGYNFVDLLAAEEDALATFYDVQKALKEPNNLSDRLMIREWQAEYDKAMRSANPEKTFIRLILPRRIKSLVVHETAHSTSSSSELRAMLYHLTNGGTEYETLAIAYFRSKEDSSDFRYKKLDPGAHKNFINFVINRAGIQTDQKLDGLSRGQVRNLAREFLLKSY